MSKEAHTVLVPCRFAEKSNRRKDEREEAVSEAGTYNRKGGRKAFNQ